MGRSSAAGFRCRDAGQAVRAVMSGLRFLAGSDATALTAAERSGCLLGLEHAEGVLVLARAGLLAAFDAADDFELDGQRSAGAWLVNKGRVTKAEAAGQRAWVKRRREHPVLAAAMVTGDLSRSWAVKVMSVTGKIPAPHRVPADRIIVAAAKAGAPLHQLVFIAAEILARVAPPDDDDDGFKDRRVRLETTLDGAGVLRGDLTPQCAAAVQAVLGEFARRRGKEDRRSAGERWHDALEEAMTRLLGSDLAPRRSGHPVTALVHVGLADVLALDDGSVVQQQWSADLAARWAAHRARASAQPGDGGTWITGPAARGIVCDAALFPVVEGTADLTALDELVRLCVELDGLWHHGDADGADGAGSGDADAGDDDADAGDDDADAGDDAAGEGDADANAAAGRDAGAGAGAARVRELCQAIIGQAVALLSGEAGLASHLRRDLLGQAGLGGRSLPLDAGDVDAVPWWLRRTVTTRDQSCRWPGGCSEPAAACQPHHLVHRHQHGPTRLANLYSLCPFHHLVVVHRWGWTLTVRGDGTLAATSPDGTRTYQETSRPPPPRPG